MNCDMWAALGSIANVVLAVLALATTWQSRAATRAAAAAAASAAQSVELQLNATQPWLETSGGGKDFRNWEIALQTVEGAHWVHGVELVDMTFEPTVRLESGNRVMPSEQPKNVQVGKPLTPIELVQPGGGRVSVEGWPVFVDETEWLLFHVDAAALLGDVSDESQWILTWRLRAVVSPSKAGLAQRRVIVDARVRDRRWRQREDNGPGTLTTPMPN